MVIDFAVERKDDVVSDIELIQFYRCESLNELLFCAADVCQSIGAPLLSLTWTPAPGPEATMLRNYTRIWDNCSDYFGQQGESVSSVLSQSMLVAMKQAGTNTKACQTWKLQNKEVFQVFEDAPDRFFLSHHQRQVLRDFDNQSWPEFFAVVICRERDRALLLIAKTPAPLPERDAASLFRLLETAANAYRFLYTKTQPNRHNPLQSQEIGVLSSREVECLQWLASGKTLCEAAIILGISERTLRYHISNARERLGVATTVQAIVAAALTYGFDPRDARRSICASSRP
jgi:DNA-binding CsgD family transcriptional regulator